MTLTCMPAPASLLPILRPQRSHRRAGLPHLRFAHGSQLFIQLFTIIRITVLIQNDASFNATRHALVKGIKDWCDRVAEPIFPVECAALCSSGTIGVHPIHAVLTDKTDQGLCEFFYCFI